MKFGVAVINGTTALQVIVGCLDLEAGGEVIMPYFTIISCAMAIVEHGLLQVLVDSDPRTKYMDVSQIEARITNPTRAIMEIHNYGHPVEMDPLLALAIKHNLMTIEGATEAYGAEYLSGLNGASTSWKCCRGMG